ncbi:hypothetical protein P5673_002057 [Acropora cervicornis]|uniref:Uncharacterized protein n=1 Tax=Acropora cervicornis TaxID=6130 RepID=A0AAD9R4L3_ACRCE|nr:hypothetical protein P5673_002057 [Acropora cervicornis]
MTRTHPPKHPRKILKFIDEFQPSIARKCAFTLFEVQVNTFKQNWLELKASKGRQRQTMTL